ncbi:hypothetical protein [Polaribacter cellanae]|uniref:Uncharacterized protein n=1 Tax=Polaribacter cellanae TaxID=2818493 RepID=A0A975CML8_9FLAO|nr:hypothetical protein [Polaribacter cellanae]QTE21320.1 hypothetical protein J3359_10815 [Polaribacter cellanae]
MKNSTNKIAKLLKLGMFLFGIILLWSCEKENEVVPNSDLQDKTSTISKISLDAFLEKNNTTTQGIGFKKKKQANNNSKKTNKPSYKISSSTVLSYTNKKGKTTYILPLKKSTKDPSYIYNLVIKKTDNNLEKYIYKYPKDKSKPIEISKIGKTNSHKKASHTHKKGKTCETFTRYRVIPCPCVGHIDPYTCFCAIRPQWFVVGSYQVCTTDNTEPDIEEPDGDSASESDDDTIIFIDNGCRRNREGISECPPAEENPDVSTPFEPLPIVTEEDLLDNNFAFSDALDLTREQQDWINNEKNEAVKDAITSYLQKFALTNNNKFENAKSFAYESILALYTNPLLSLNNIDFDDQIINELTGKLKCVYDNLKSNNLLNKTLEKFDGKKTPVHLLIKEGDLISPRVGVTNYGSTGYFISITFDKSYSNDNPSLEVVSTILHEAIHAEIYRKIKTTSGLYLNSSTNKWELGNGAEVDFPTLFNYYNNYPQNPHHNFMADYYLDAIEQGLRDYAKSIGKTYPDNLYRDLAWGGLMTTNAWNNMFADPVHTENEQKRISKSIKDFKNSGTNECK